jgi:DNA-binding NarL/FixJ family response regulator
MTAEQLRQAARQLRGGEEIPTELLDALRAAVSSTVRSGRLPNSLSPYGHWGDDIVEELLQSWLADKLLLHSALLALLDRARSPAAFGSMARRSFYHWLLSTRPRSEASNIYSRLVAALEDHPEQFRVAVEASERQHRWWALADDQDAVPFAGDDRNLAAAAMAAGELAIVRYSTSSRLSPVISSAQLLRYCQAVMAALSAALTPALLMRALATRVDLGDVRDVALEEGRVTHEDVLGDPAGQLELRESALAVLGQLTPRQAEILLATERGDETGAQLAQRLECSPATISNEQRRVGNLIDQLTADDAERTSLLKKLVDLLYEGSDD